MNRWTAGYRARLARLNWNKVLEFSWRSVVFVIAVGIVIVVTTNWSQWAGRQGWQTTNDAYIESDLTPISAKIGGYLRDLPVQDYEAVRKGQVLARLVDDDYRATLEQAQAQILTARAQVQALQAQHQLQLSNVKAARAIVASTSATLEQNTRDVQRQQRLMATGSSSTEAGEKLQTVRAQLQAQLEQNRAQASAAERQLAVLQAQVVQAEAAVAVQRAAADGAEINLGYTSITAPQDGVVGQRLVKPGQLVGAGTQITSLIPVTNVWVIANFREIQLTHMAVGQRARITVDTYPGHTLKGHLLAFAPASGAVFALLPPDNATGNFTKIVQRLAVKIAIDDADGLDGRLAPGMSVEAKVDARDERK
jgi:membrane fusion protein, multidrug efflux system